MKEVLSSMLWALPLVLALGSAIILLLRHVVRPASEQPVARRLRLAERLEVSERTTVHLIDADGDTFMLVEPAAGIPAVVLLHAGVNAKTARALGRPGLVVRGMMRSPA